MSDEEIQNLFNDCVPAKFVTNVTVSKSRIRPKTFFLYVEDKLAKSINPFLKGIGLETIYFGKGYAFSIFSFDLDSDIDVEIEERLYDWKCFWKRYETWYI